MSVSSSVSNLSGGGSTYTSTSGIWYKMMETYTTCYKFPSGVVGKGSDSYASDAVTRVSDVEIKRIYSSYPVINRSYVKHTVDDLVNGHNSTVNGYFTFSTTDTNYNYRFVSGYPKWLNSYGDYIYVSGDGSTSASFISYIYRYYLKNVTWDSSYGNYTFNGSNLVNNTDQSLLTYSGSYTYTDYYNRSVDFSYGFNFYMSNGTLVWQTPSTVINTAGVSLDNVYSKIRSGLSCTITPIVDSYKLDSVTWGSSLPKFCTIINTADGGKTVTIKYKKYNLGV